MDEGTVVVDGEREIGNLIALLQEHLLVEGLDLVEGADCLGGKIIESFARCAVKVLGAAEDFQAVGLRHGARVLMQEHAVGLEMDYTAGLEERPVPLQEKG